MGVVYKFRTLAIFGQLTKSKSYRIIKMNIKCLSNISHVKLSMRCTSTTAESRAKIWYQ